MNRRLQIVLALALLSSGAFYSTLAPVVRAEESGADLPYLIRRQPRAFHTAWREVAELVRENEALEQPLPDPLFARADLWARVGNREEAVDDYLRATKLLLARHPTLVEQSRALEQLREKLEQLAEHPLPDFPAEAQGSFQAGLSNWAQHQIPLAATCFAEASRLRPLDPVYRAYRGLAYRRLGRTAEAERQLAIAAALLRRPGDPERARQEFHLRLEHLQGPDRGWIEVQLNRPSPDRSGGQDDAARWLESAAVKPVVQVKKNVR
jgi:tetratricopeptide (TPR) repeat protein